jgi:hypothetical protein
MVLREHKQFYDEIFRIEGFLNSPFLMFGFQEITPNFYPRLKDAKSFKGLLHLMGVKNVTVLDYEDKRADVHWDMNYPTTQHTNRYIGGFNVVADIGCLEHVWNANQAMKNCMDAVKVGGLYFLHTPVAGYCRHGLHTFNPDILQWIVQKNGFEIEYCKFSFKNGVGCLAPPFGQKENVLIWLVARRKKVMDQFHMPIQERQLIKESRITSGLEAKPINVIPTKIVKETEEGNITEIIATEGYIGEGHDPIAIADKDYSLGEKIIVDVNKRV